MTKLNEEFSKYEKDDEKNLLHAVQWCIDKDLVQQGITQLQEAVITILCEKIGEDYMKRKNREIVSSYLTFGIRKPSEEWEGVLKGEIAELLIDKLEEIESLEEISDRYSALTDKRNTINHGGFTDKDAKSSKFKDVLSKNYEELKKLL